MTGGGFGGSAIALVRQADTRAVATAVAAAFADEGLAAPAFLRAVPLRRRSGSMADAAGSSPAGPPVVTGFERDGLVFDVRDGGPRDGDVVVLLHGFPQDSTAWSEVEPILHAAGLRTLAPDQRGYSPGARPGGVAAYRLKEISADVVALLDAAASRARTSPGTTGAAPWSGT